MTDAIEIHVHRRLPSPVRRQRQRLLHHCFEGQARRRPDRTAIRFDGARVSYGELDMLANQIAHALIARGVVPGSLVALHHTKAVGLYAGMLGILKTGAGYVPLDTKLPDERIADVLEDSGAVAIVTNAELVHNVRDRGLAILDTDADRGEIDDADHHDPAVAISDSSLAYAIYTSGSTGRPKGVGIEHRNALAFVNAIPPVYRVGRMDRVYQGFSVAFDASVEEIWAAFSTGAELVVPHEITARSPTDVAEFLIQNRVTFFSTVPTFLSLLDRELPNVRTLVLGGEACSAELVERWADGRRRMLNTYGPTEATVVATFAECVRGEPITIGKALPGYSTVVLDENGRRVEPGEIGELYIGGPAVARGYLNRPELTAERFIADPSCEDMDDEDAGRLYRTFDQVRLTHDGDLEFLGRLDSQVKIRGFRIELSEIEQVLLGEPQIRAAAVGVSGAAEQQEIAAYVVVEPDAELDRGAIAERLRHRLPEYMVPRFLDVVESLPMMVSGKIDRKALPEPREPLAGSGRAVVAPETEIETIVARHAADLLRLEQVSVTEDFFTDLGGHSLIAAQLISRLRSELGTDQLSIRHLYVARTIRAFAVQIDALRQSVTDTGAPASDRPTASEAAFASVPWPTRWCVVTVQLLVSMLIMGIVAFPLAATVGLVLAVIDGTLEFDTATQMGTVLAFGYWPCLVALSIVVKWLVIGRYKAGRYPVWGGYYLRWWVATRFQALSWSDMFTGSPLMSLYWRAMGARVGRNVMICTPIAAAFDLITVGDDSSIGDETHILGYRVEDGMLVIGGVSIGRDCFVGEHCAIGLDVAIANGARLDDMSSLPDGTRLEPGSMWRGAPAAPVGDVDVPPTSPRKHGALLGLAQLALIYVMGYLLIASLLPALVAVAAALYYWGPVAAAAVSVASVPVSVIWYAVLVILVKRIVLGKSKPGHVPVESIAYLRHWFLSYLLRNTRTILMPLYATIYFPWFLRRLGARVGTNSEVSTVLQFSPDLLEIGSGSFLADACLVGGQRVHNGTLELRSNRIGSRTFIGNSAVVPAGVDIGDDCLIGVLSTPPAGVAQVPSGTSWLGAPSFALPRGGAGSCFSASETFDPPVRLKRQRAVIDAIRVVLPGVIHSLAAAGFVTLICAAVAAYGYWSLIAAVPLAATAIAIASIAAAAAIKRAVVGRFVPLVRPLYSPFVWANELVNGVYESVAAPMIMPFLGTPFASVGLRAMGCRIGRWAFVETTLFSEFDLVEIGDHAALNLGSTIQTHLFEDRIFKADTLRIGTGCSIGNMAVVLYGTTMEPGSRLGMLSLLMKGERLPHGTAWQGIPSQAVRQNVPQNNATPCNVEIFGMHNSKKQHCANKDDRIAMLTSVELN